MEELTPAEHSVVLAELGWPGAPERARLHASGLPASTYHVARRRLLAEGWLTTAGVPQPASFGIQNVEIVFVRPTLSERLGLLAGWAARPECVALFSGLHSALGIFFRATVGSVGAPTVGSTGFVCRAGPGRGGIPVYLDLAGAWARFGGHPRPDPYPRGLEFQGSPATERAQSFARTSLEVEGASPGRSPSNAVDSASPLVAPVAWLDLSRVPPFAGRRLGEIIYVTGRRRPGTDPRQLLNTLTGDRSVYPYLFAWEGERVLFAGLGLTSAQGPGRRPVRSATGSVQQTLVRCLDPVEVTIEPVEAHSVPVIHRYGPALLAARGGPTSGRETSSPAREFTTGSSGGRNAPG